MARKNHGTITHTKARRVSIPAGHDYLIVKPGETFYLIEPDGKLPQHLQETVDKREQVAYERGVTDGAQMQERDSRQFTVEEALQHILRVVRQYDAKDQNQILAVMMDEMRKSYEDRMKSLAETIAHHQGLLNATEQAFAGFIHVRNGGFEKLNFR